MTPIETKRLLLRPLVPTDFGDYLEIFKDEAIMKPSNRFPARDNAEAAGIFEYYLKLNGLAIVLKEANQVIGSFSIMDWLLDDSFKDVPYKTLGYEISREFQGQGLATEALQAVIDYLFKETDVQILWASHFDFNPASKRVLEKAGFTYHNSTVATLQVLNGESCGYLHYKLRKPQ